VGTVIAASLRPAKVASSVIAKSGAVRIDVWLLAHVTDLRDVR